MAGGRVPALPKPKKPSVSLGHCCITCGFFFFSLVVSPEEGSSNLKLSSKGNAFLILRTRKETLEADTLLCLLFMHLCWDSGNSMLRYSHPVPALKPDSKIV